MSREKYETEMPWWNTKKWKPDEWYPMPFGYMERDQPEYIIEGYMIFKQSNPNGDIEPTFPSCFLFSTALRICEEHNNRTMIELDPSLESK